MSKRILLVGASGFIGQALLHQLRAAGHQVTACVRDAGRVAGDIPVVEADYTTHTRSEQWLPLLDGFAVVINAVGIVRERGANTFAQIHTRGPVALFDAALAAGVKQIVQISALGSDASAVTPFHLSKRAADDHLAAKACDWLILRPSLIYGDGCKSATLFKAIAALPLIPLPGRGDQLVQPVAIEDLLGVVSSFIDGAIKPRQRIDVVGPQPITLREMMSHYRRWLGAGRARFLAIPEAISLWLAQCLGLFGINASARETLELLRRGNTADVQRLIEQTGLLPTAMSDALQRRPAQQSERWQAHLYFLHPLLRITLGLMWLWTALVSAGLYPIEQSLELLSAVGLSGTAAMVTLVGATLLDLLLGLALLLRRHVTGVAWLQILLMVGYSLIIAWALPAYWFHPFGPLIKNLPLIIATLMLIAMER